MSGGTGAVPDLTAIPRVDVPPPVPEPRQVRFEPATEAVRRRGFLAVLGTAAMTLGLTVLGWIPLARPARAEPGTEYLDCGAYADGPGGPLCVGAPYSEDYCGEDDWFRSGCFAAPSGTMDCYEPLEACHADGEGRNAWRWNVGEVVYRCADGRVLYEGAPNPEFVICSALLYDPRRPPWMPEVPELPLQQPPPAR